MKTCLIVDDSRVVRKVIRRIVEECDFSCSEAENGQKALDECEKALPDAILLNWNMPVMNGIQFLEKLRGMKNGKNPKVIFCTTENSVEKIRQAINAGADEYIMKPFDSEIIMSKLVQAGLIEQRRGGR
jgi:two-component system, chemotaxis family, chemotaxis protein CheY